MNKFLIFIALFLFSNVQFFSQTALPEKDFQVWNETQVFVPLKKSKDKKTEQVSLIFYGLLRGAKYRNGLFDERIGVGFEFKIKPYLTLTPSYIYRAGQPLAGKKEYESRLRFDVQFEKKFRHFSLKDRSRVEHRFRNSKADSTRYRNKFQFTVPVKKGDKEIFAPFVATEPFYEFQSKHWTRNELSFGIGKKFNSNVSAEFFYLLQNNRGNTLKYVNVAGVNLKFKID